MNFVIVMIRSISMVRVVLVELIMSLIFVEWWLEVDVLLIFELVVFFFGLCSMCC